MLHLSVHFSTCKFIISSQFWLIGKLSIFHIGYWSHAGNNKAYVWDFYFLLRTDISYLTIHPCWLNFKVSFW